MRKRIPSDGARADFPHTQFALRNGLPIGRNDVKKSKRNEDNRG